MSAPRYLCTWEYAPAWEGVAVQAKSAVAAAVAVAGLGLSACGGQPAVTAPVPPSATSTGGAGSATMHHQSATAATAGHARGHGGTVYGLRAVHDPGEVTGTFTGPCHIRDHGLLPDRSCTPGAIDPAVTQANIGSTICRAGYTDSVRPPEAQTEAFKWNVAEPAYGQHDVSGELDHLIPLELGGDNDAKNLWVEAGPIPNPKDAVENALNQAVCAGQIPLRAAQREIARNWTKVAAALGIRVTSPQPTQVTGSGPRCTATASYSSSYGDWDVYVHSNQPNSPVTASGGGYSHSWHTDSSGYADVYLRGPSPGQAIDVTAGSAHCTTAAP
jgi:hypothetical protein